MSTNHTELLQSIHASVILVEDYQKKIFSNQSPHGEVENALNALSDIAALWQAHTTKLALAFKPPISKEAAQKCLEESSKLPEVLISACLGITDKEDPSKLMRQDAKNKVDDLYKSQIDLLHELEDVIDRETSLLQDRRPASSSSNARTLVSVGEVWDRCSRIQELVKMGPNGVLQMRMNESSVMLGDAVKELKEWIDDPQSSSLDYFGDDFDDDHDGDSGGENPASGDVDPKLVELATKWYPLVKGLPIVIQSLCKVLCKQLSTTDASKLHKVDKSINQINEFADRFVSSVHENLLNEALQDINDLKGELVTITNLLAKPDDRFSDQLKAFCEKFNQ